MTDSTQSTDYSEPSASTVELDTPPAWLNLDEIITPDERERIKDLIEEGRDLLVRAAAWGREAVPLTIHEWPASTQDIDEFSPMLDHLCGIDELEELDLPLHDRGRAPVRHRQRPREAHARRASRARASHCRQRLSAVEEPGPRRDLPAALVRLRDREVGRDPVQQ
jgi:hypothetical protein